jgi:MFS family permease
MLDVAVMDVALPTVGHDLGLEGASITWALNAYVVALGGLLLAGGRLADLIGCRQALRLGGLVFGIAATGSLVAPSAGWFLASRAVQGAGTAILLPAALTVVSTSAADGRQGRERSPGGRHSPSSGRSPACCSRISSRSTARGDWSTPRMS